jgi:hypothetical protein
MTTLTPAVVPAAPADAGTAPSTALPPWRWTAALAVATAGGLHVAAAADHVGMGQLVVGFFLLTALAQLGTAAWIVVSTWAGTRANPALVTLVLAGTVALIGLYVVAHTTGLLAAFGITEAAGAHSHAGTHGAETMTRFDPVTGVDFTQGLSVDSGGAVAMDGNVSSAGHAPGLLGTTTLAAELLAVAGLTALLPRTWRGRAVNALFALGGLAWLLWFTGVLG